MVSTAPIGNGQHQPNVNVCEPSPYSAGTGAAAVADIVRSMRKTRTSDISVSRKELIKKGLVYAPERGLLAFTVPGMYNFVDCQP